jgi:integrase
MGYWKMNVTEALADWRSYRARMVELRLVAQSTHDNQSAIVQQLYSALGHHRLDALRKSHIELWMGERLRTCAPVTVRGELNVLRQVLNWCVDEGHLLTKPRLPTLSVPNVEADLPSDEAFLWVLANVPANHAAALEFMMLTGLSPHELERVQVQDVRDVPRRLYEGESFDLGIGQRPDFAVKQPSRRRWVPLNGRARDVWFEVTAGRHPALPAFPRVDAMQKAIRRSIAGAILPYDGTHDGIQLAATLAKEVARISPKLMRKWFASKVASQQPEHVLQRLMGHAPGSPITRRHYVRSNEGQGRDAVADLSL